MPVLRASDGPDALETAARLLRDVGFELVEVGGLTRAGGFDVST